MRGDVLAGVLSTEVLLAGAVLAGAVLAGAVLAAAVLVLLAVLAVTVLAVAVLGSGAGCGDVLAGVLSGAVLAGAVLAGSVLAAAVLVVLAVLAVAVLAVLRWCAGRRSDVWESAGWGDATPPIFPGEENGGYIFCPHKGVPREPHLVERGSRPGLNAALAWSAGALIIY
jgi:hypothetical protein